MSTFRPVSRPRTTALGLLVGLSAGSIVALDLAASAGAATAAVAAVTTTSGKTKYASTNIRTGPSTAYTAVKQVPLGTAVTGTEANGWIKITSPSTLAGRYIAI